MEVFPDTITSGVTMYYYKNPDAPKWTYQVVGSVPVFNPAAGDFVDFILPDIAYDEIINELALYLGIQIKQPDVTQIFDKKDNESEQLKRA